MPESRRLLLIVPGLLGPAPDPEALAALAPDMPALGRLLSRADSSRDVATSGEGALCEVFGVDGPPWPVAAAARAGEADADDRVGSRYWLRADPVHLRIDTSQARLFAGYALDLEARESAGLVEALNAHFAADGLRFEAPAPDRWYLALEQPAALDTHAPAEVVGRNVDAFMPTGADARAWRTRLNEAQMLLHAADVNTERERAGALPANSIWLWGGGEAPRPVLAPAQVLGSDPLSRGLARLAGDHLEPGAQAPAIGGLPAHGGDWEPRTGTTLVTDWRLRDPLIHGDPDAWAQALERIEADWLVPLLERLQVGAFDELEIRPADGRRFRISRRGLRRFWRRTRAWAQWLEPAP